MEMFTRLNTAVLGGKQKEEKAIRDKETYLTNRFLPWIFGFCLTKGEFFFPSSKQFIILREHFLLCIVQPSCI